MKSTLIALMCVLALCSTLPAADPPITAAVFMPSGNALFVGSQAGIEMRSWPKLQASSPRQAPLPHLHDLAFSPDGKQLLVAGGSPGENGVAILLGAHSREELRRVAAHRDVIYRVAWSPDSSEFATASADGYCQVFDATTGKAKAKYSGHSRPVLAIAYLPDGKHVLSAGVDQTLQLWDSATGKQVRTLDNHLAAVNDLAVKPGTPADAPPVVVSVSDDRTVRLWQPTIGRLMRFAKLDSPARCVAWSMDGKQILVGCNDGTICSVDPDSVAVTKLATKFPGRIHVMLAAPDGTALVGGQGGVLKVIETGK